MYFCISSRIQYYNEISFLFNKYRYWNFAGYLPLRFPLLHPQKKEIMLILQHLSYVHPDKSLLFKDIDLVLNKQEKVALLGDNGVGKSTLLKIITSELPPSGGIRQINSTIYQVPQLYGQFNHLRIAEVLGVATKLNALQSILAGKVDPDYFNQLEDDWSIEDRCKTALEAWGLKGLDLQQSMSQLSGGQKMRVLLSGINIQEPELIVMDEPSNHLDREGRQLLLDFIDNTTATLLVVSHDRELLNHFNHIYELSTEGITSYGGNYAFYMAQKELELSAINAQVGEMEKTARKVKAKERAAIERKEKLDARGRTKKLKEGLPTISMKTLKNNAEKSTTRLKQVHSDKVADIASELKSLRKLIPDLSKIKLSFQGADLHKGKILFQAKDLNFSYGGRSVWDQAISLMITSGDRLAIKGANASGKTTLLSIILGQLQPTHGEVGIAAFKALYIDQDYSIVNTGLHLFQQVERFNTNGLQEHELKRRLSWFLFTKADWDKPCQALSGGERMRLLLCCMTISEAAPDMIVLDEPTNNLDIQNIEILTTALKGYTGTLLVVSHDQVFLEGINVHKSIELPIILLA